MGTTPRGLPWPEDTAFVYQGAQAMRALAEEVDDQLTADAAVRDAADTALDGRLDVLEGRQHVSALVDAAGDLLVGTGPDVLGRLGKGADGTVLTVTAGAVGWQPASGIDRTLVTGFGHDTKSTGSSTPVQMHRVVASDSSTSGGSATRPVPVRLPRAGSVTGLSVTMYERSGASASDTATFEVFVDGVATGLTCTVAAVSTNSAGAVVTQAAGLDAVPAGGRIDVRRTSAATNSIWNAEAAVEITH